MNDAHKLAKLKSGIRRRNARLNELAVRYQEVDSLEKSQKLAPEIAKQERQVINRRMADLNHAITKANERLFA